MRAAAIVIERHDRDVYRLRHGRFLLAAVLPNLARAATLAASLAGVLRVQLRYRATVGTASVLLPGHRTARYRP